MDVAFSHSRVFKELLHLLDRDRAPGRDIGEHVAPFNAGSDERVELQLRILT